MSPPLGKRTPQQPLTEGRPKRQAVLNRKSNVDIAKGSATKSPVKKVIQQDNEVAGKTKVKVKI